MSTNEAYPLSWPNGWPRTPADKREISRFHSRETTYANGGSWSQKRALTIYAAMRRLTDELGKLGARGVHVTTNVALKTNGEPRSAGRQPDDPGVAVYFVLAKKDRVLACDRWNTVAGNIAAIAGHVDAIRRQERYGVGTVDQAFAGYAALPPPGAPGKRHWRDVLMVDDNLPANPDTIEMQYRRLALERHPDAGGNAEQMAELNAAIAEARAELGQ